MKAEALRLDGELSAANDRIDDLERRNDTLTANNQQLVADSTRLFMSYTDLQQRYQQLLADGSAESARMLKELEENQMALNERSRRVDELEAMLRSREEAINNIRNKKTDALTGFDGKGLFDFDQKWQTFMSQWKTSCFSVREVSRLIPTELKQYGISQTFWLKTLTSTSWLRDTPMMFLTAPTDNCEITWI